MTDMRYFGRTGIAAALAAVLAAGGACTLKDQETPDPTGPSEFGTSISMTATPDTIVQDGASQSIIQVVVRDFNSQPLSNLAMRLEVEVNGVRTTEFGRLSTQNLVSGSDGRATAVYTAPPAPLDLNDPEPSVRFLVTPVGTNYDNSGFARSVSLRLVRPNIAEVPGAPVADFTYTPSSPRVGGQVQFNGQASTDPDGVIVRYDWDYGDGDQESGVTQSHDFLSIGTYQVTLTVTDNVGLKASKTRTIVVSP
jgi:PKD repeat protein